MCSELEELHEWVTATRSWREMHRQEGGTTRIDDDFAARAKKDVGAWILGLTGRMYELVAAPIQYGSIFVPA